MSQESLYFPLWQKYLPIIALQMKNAKNGEREITLYKNEFKEVGDRKVSDFSFNLEIKNGRVASNIRGTAAARGLYEKLTQNKATKQLLTENFYKIQLFKDYRMKIERIPQAEAVEDAV